MRGKARYRGHCQNGLPLWGGAHLAVDVTLVSAFDTNGAPAQPFVPRAKPRSARTPSCCARRGAGWSSWPSRSPAAGARKQHVSSASSPAARLVPCPGPPFRRRCSPHYPFSIRPARALASSLVAGHLPGTVNVNGPAPELSDVPSAAASWHAEPLSLLPAVLGFGLGRNALGPRKKTCSSQDRTRASKAC